MKTFAISTLVPSQPQAWLTPALFTILPGANCQDFFLRHDQLAHVSHCQLSIFGTAAKPIPSQISTSPFFLSNFV